MVHWTDDGVRGRILWGWVPAQITRLRLWVLLVVLSSILPSVDSSQDQGDMLRNF
jgi:hypothetical protein